MRMCIVDGAVFIGYGYAYQMTQSVGRAREQLNNEQTNKQTPSMT